ncbi:DUF5689 domain-containing protein [Tenacibaculum finnmarkense]|uniref:DUF5689 domain-containing protein n=1 Tax=Tenacibaculum finnmarkense TaxID=2781243 RepID=UPI001EFA7648|nr:DUF5689 domain-containing protein [Tenacibaculum finnmarkense]MCG8802708.1 lamin tail domain-containing protein [Tenacibaculum finnmarkense]MCG8825436.1 lamin tail domain-containing protein [Tenacibaculum finnmarkense]
MKIVKLSILVFIIFIVVPFSSCVGDDEFSLPTLSAEKEYENLKSLTQIASLYQGSLVEIKEELTTSGYVVSSDRAGNFFKSIFIQDAPENPTIGFEMKINATNLHERYAVGRKIFIKLKGLFLSKSKDGSYQIGVRNSFGNGIDRIGVNDYVRFIDRGAEIAKITPVLLKINELNEKNQNILIKIEKVQAEIKGLKYAWPKAGSVDYSIDRTLISCDSLQKIIFRNSVFSDFKGLLIPDKKGSITGIFTMLESEKILTIRNTSDVNFTEEYGCFNNPTLADVATIKAFFKEEETVISDNLKLKISITSDATKGTISAKNAFAQDASAGISLNFTAIHNLNIGDQVEIAVGGLKLTNPNGVLTLNVENSNIISSQPGVLPTPEIITFEEALSGVYQSKLVKIEGVQFKDITKNYQGENILTTNCENELALLSVEKEAVFANNLVSTKKGAITGIITQNNGVKLYIRDELDVNFTETYGCTPVVIPPPINPAPTGDLFFSEYAEGSSNNKYIEIYNGANTDIDLSNYTIELHINGSTDKPKILALSSLTNIILVKGGVLVIYNSRASDVIKNNGTSSSSVASFNGDDALVLKNNDTVIDVIGLLGEDPGKGWAVAGIENATQNHTLIRKSSVVKGNITWNASAGTTTDNSQWEVKEQDDFSSVGKK